MSCRGKNIVFLAHNDQVSYVFNRNNVSFEKTSNNSTNSLCGSGEDGCDIQCRADNNLVKRCFGIGDLNKVPSTRPSISTEIMSQQILDGDSNYPSPDSDFSTSNNTDKVENNVVQNCFGTNQTKEETSKPSDLICQPFLNADSDDSVHDPDFSISGTESDGEDETENRKGKQLTRWKRSQPSNWKRNISKKRRSLGLNYEFNKLQRPPKKPQAVNCEKCRFKCQTKFSEAEREVICSLYWKMTDFKRQKDFLLSNITSTSPERRRQRNGNKGPRSNSKQYYFEKDKNKMRICQNKGPAGTYIGEDKRGRSVPGNKTAPDLLAAVKEHIESFPTVKSHYSRKTTQKEYLDSKLSISKMYSLYREKSEVEGKQCVTFITYKRIFGKDYNLSFFKPKKDLCQICETHKTAENAENNDVYESHERRKKDCYVAKNMDKVQATNDASFVSATFDLQSVLQIPCSDVSPMYYSRKICVYNLTIYNSAPPNDAYCYCWSELNGKRGSSEIGSCLLLYLTNLPSHVKKVSLWSDTCGGQNRNQHVAALLLYLVQVTHLETIQHNFLESGHTYMEADSMHSSIEHAKKFVPVYTINDWLNIFRLARSKRNKNKKSEPYNVREMKFNAFYDLKALSEVLIRNKTKDTEGQTVNWLLIKSLRYSKENPSIIEYKYIHDGPYKCINVFGRGKKPTFPKNLKKLYSKPLIISEKKKRDLLKLCKSGSIPVEFHGWYQSLPTSDKLLDYSAEPCVDDCEVEDMSDSDDELPLIHLVQKKKKYKQEKNFKCRLVVKNLNKSNLSFKIFVLLGRVSLK